MEDCFFVQLITTSPCAVADMKLVQQNQCDNYHYKIQSISRSKETPHYITELKKCLYPLVQPTLTESHYNTMQAQI